MKKKTTVKAVETKPVVKVEEVKPVAFLQGSKYEW